MSTPALARAAEEFERLDDRHGLLYPEHALLVPDIAKRLVSAALRHPDKGRDPVAEALCSHDESVHHMERTDDFPCSACVSAADAVRAEILGGA